MAGGGATTEPSSGHGGTPRRRLGTEPEQRMEGGREGRKAGQSGSQRTPRGGSGRDICAHPLCWEGGDRQPHEPERASERRERAGRFLVPHGEHRSAAAKSPSACFWPGEELRGPRRVPRPEGCTDPPSLPALALLPLPLPPPARGY